MPTNNIFNRNRNDTIDAVTLLWRAFCDPKPQKSIKKYMDKEAIVVLPDGGILSQDTEPNRDDFFEEHFEPWTAYRMDQEEDDMHFVEVDLMSTSLTYKLTAWQQVGGDKSRMKPMELLCTTVLKQEASGDWTTCMHHMAHI